MIATACTLAAVLVLETTAPATSSDCLTADNLCKARRSERRAATAPTPDQRAQYLHSAHRSYLFLFDQTGDMRDLCSARRTFDASVAVKGQSAAQRASAARSAWTSCRGSRSACCRRAGSARRCSAAASTEPEQPHRVLAAAMLGRTSAGSAACTAIPATTACATR